MLLLTHMPFWVYWIGFGLLLGTVLTLVYRDRWPTPVRLLVFVLTVACPPLALATWIAWGLMGPHKTS